MTYVDLASIRTDGPTQLRTTLDRAAVEDLARAYEAKEEVPGPVVYDDGDELWLADGFHRVAAMLSLGWTRCEVEYQEGTVADALLYAAGANRKHGVRMTNACKRNAVAAMLEHPEASEWSSRKIAEHVGCSHTLVNTMRAPPEEREEEIQALAEEQEADEEPPAPVDPVRELRKATKAQGKVIEHLLAAGGHEDALEDAEALRSELEHRLPRKEKAA